jgi:hypothetical protein
MRRHLLYRAALPCAALLVLVGCAHKDADTAEKQPAQASAPVIQHQQLADSDLAGLDPANISVDLPWTNNSVRRNPAPSAAWATLTSVDVAGHDGFDRTTFTFVGGTPFTGYRVKLQKAGATLACDGKEAPSKLKGDVLLTVELSPARASRNGKALVPVRTRDVKGQQRVVQQGLTCDAADDVTWAAGLAQGSEVRVLELRNPQRLVVDVR